MLRCLFDCDVLVRQPESPNWGTNLFVIELLSATVILAYLATLEVLAPFHNHLDQTLPPYYA